MIPSMTILNAQIKSARADMIKGRIDITISVGMSDITLALRRELSYLAYDETQLTILITPEERQPQLTNLNLESTP